MIELYSAPTPNGHKASCTLEALELEYNTHFVNISEGDQHEPEFRAINPNGRIPAIVDRDFDDLAIFESGAIMIHLAEKTGRLLPSDPRGRARVMQWAISSTMKNSRKSSRRKRDRHCRNSALTP